MKPLTAARLLACLCLALWLSACSDQPSRLQPQLSAPQVIDVPEPAWKPLPAALTAPLAYPAPPAAACTADGVATVCALAGLLWIESWRSVVDQANADRALAAKLSAPASAATQGQP